MTKHISPADLFQDTDSVDEHGRRHTFRAARPRAFARLESAKIGDAVSRKRRSAHRADCAKQHFRPYDRDGDNARTKAIEYALWLAARDGIEVPAEGRAYNPRKGRWEGTWSVEFDWRYYVGHNRASTVIATRVHFGAVTIDIPHTNYDPTIVPVEIIEEPAR